MASLFESSEFLFVLVFWGELAFTELVNDAVLSVCLAACGVGGGGLELCKSDKEDDVEECPAARIAA